MALDPETLAAVNNYRKLRNQQRRRAVGQYLGAAGAGLSGQQGGVNQEYILGGVEGKDAWTTQLEKMGMRTELERGLLTPQEQFVAQLTQEDILTRMKEDQDNWRTAQRMIQQRYASDVSAASERARREEKFHSDAIDRNFREQEELNQPSEDGKRKVAGIVGQIQQDADTMYAVSLNNMQAEWLADNFSPSGDTEIPGDVQSVLENQARAVANQAAAEGLLNDNVISSMLDEDDKAKGYNALRSAAAQLGVELDTAVAEAIRKGDLAPQTATDIQMGEAILAAANDDLVLERSNLETSWANSIGVGARQDPQILAELERFGQRAEERSAEYAMRVASSPGSMEEASVAATQAASAPAAPTVAGAAPAALTVPTVPTGAAVAPSGAPTLTPTPGAATGAPQPGANELLGVPMPAGMSGQQRTLALLDMVLNMPEYPPAQQAKMMLIQSPEFEQYSQSRGYTGMDENMILREMTREARIKNRENRRAFRRQRHMNRVQGVSPERGIAGELSRVSEERRGEPNITDYRKYREAQKRANLPNRAAVAGEDDLTSVRDDAMASGPAPVLNNRRLQGGS